MTLEFRSVTVSVVGTNSPLLGKSLEVTWNVCNVDFGDVIVKPVCSCLGGFVWTQT